MANQSDDSSQIQALENELVIVRNELLNLQSARSVRLAKFAKQVLRSRPAEWSELIKSTPAVFKRQSAPSVERRQVVTKKANFSPLYNSQPLYKFPHVNVAVLGETARELFYLCCNTVDLGSERFRELTEYNAIAIVALSDEDGYSDSHIPIIKNALSGGAKLVVMSSSTDFVNKVEQDFTLKPIVFTKDQGYKNSLPPVIDIYSLDYHTVAFSRPRRIITNTNLALKKIHNIPIEAVGDLDNFTHESGDIFVIEQPSESSVLHDNYLRLIASGAPTILIADERPSNAPSDLIITSKKELPTNIISFDSTYSLEQYSLSCRRDVIYENNPLRVVEHILTTTGIQTGVSQQPTISIILASKRPEFIPQAIEQLENQSLRIHEVLLNLHGVTDAAYKKVLNSTKNSTLDIKITQHDESVLFGSVLNTAVDNATGEYITKIDDDDYYGPNHLKDLYVASLYSRADLVGKWSNWVYLKSENRIINWVPENQEAYVKHLPGGTLFCKTSVLKNVRFGLVKRAIDSELYRRALARGATLYSTHRYNYVRVRDDDHTYKTTNADFKSRAHSEEIYGLDLKRVYC